LLSFFLYFLPSSSLFLSSSAFSLFQKPLQNPSPISSSLWFMILNSVPMIIQSTLHFETSSTVGAVSVLLVYTF
jgi:hypothetical protein